MSARDDTMTIGAGEDVLFVIHQRIADGQESYMGPLVIGTYTNDAGSAPEVWIECEGNRVNIPPRYLREVLRCLRAAASMGGKTDA